MTDAEVLAVEFHAAAVVRLAEQLLWRAEAQRVRARRVLLGVQVTRGEVDAASDAVDDLAKMGLSGCGH